MPTLLDSPHYRIAVADLARWLRRQPETWWHVDGDPRLTAEVNFPAPGDEIADVLQRRFASMGLIVRDGRSSPAQARHGIGGDMLDDVADVDNPRRQRTYLFQWEGDDAPWVLVEDRSSTESADG